MIYHYYFPHRIDGRNGDSTFAVVYYNTATGNAETKATGIKGLQPALDKARALAELKRQALHSDDPLQIVKLAQLPRDILNKLYGGNAAERHAWYVTQ
jgi:hypothetical protein